MPNPPGGETGASATVPAHQEAAQVTQTSDTGDIIITAQKRAQSINDVGLSITAVTSDMLVTRGVTDVSQLAKLVPGFNFNKTGDGSPVYTIRGIGYQDSAIAASPAVTAYVDEVPIPYPGGTLGAALDIEHVEIQKVLRERYTAAIRQAERSTILRRSHQIVSPLVSTGTSGVSRQAILPDLSAVRSPTRCPSECEVVGSEAEVGRRAIPATSCLGSKTAITAFLLSDEASYMTGAELGADGGVFA